MNPEYLHQANVISVEAFAGIEPSKILGRFSEFFSGVMQSCEAALQSFHTPTATGSDTIFRKFLEKNSYAKLMDREVYVPTGATGTYLEYLARLKPELDMALDIPRTVLKPFKRYVYDLASKPTRLSSVNPELAPIFGINVEIHKDVAKLDHILRQQAPTHRGDRAAYKTVVARNQDWEKVFKEIAAIDKRIADTKPEDLLQEVTDVGEVLSRLIDDIKNDPVSYKTSGVQLDNLAQLVLSVARAVEFYAAVVYIYSRFTHAVYESKDELLKTA